MIIRTSSMILLLIVFISGAAWAQQDTLPEHNQLVSNKHVLLLNSYNKGYTWTDNEVQAIEEAFANDTSTILHIEYMDTKMINTKDHFALLKQLFEHKYDKIKFDVVIATDDDALKFLRQYRETLFPDSPVVFAGINNFNPSKITGLDNITGVNEQADFMANLELILRLQPNTKDVYVIADQLTAGKLILKEFNTSAASFNNRLQFHYLTGLGMADVQDRVAKLGSNAVVFYLTFFRDGNGVGFSPWEAIPLISESASVPLYGQVDYMLGKGILGGKVKSSYYQGRIAAQLAKRILAGESAADIPIVMESPNNYMFDYQQMMRFGISVDALPQDATVINEPQTFYYKYKTLIWTVAAVIAILLLFIFILLVNIQKRKRAQKGLQDIIEAMSSVLEQDSLSKIREALVDVIHRVIFLGKPIDEVAFFNYSGKLKDYEPENLATLSGSKNPHQESLIKQAIEHQGCLATHHECVALFKNANIPANVAYLKGRRRFDDMDENLLEILTNNVSMAMESLEKNKIQQSLETARKIQLSMLPHDFREVSEPFGVDIHANLIAAKEVGGDLYDCFAIDQEHLCIAVGDVSGKGVPAALFMAMAKTLIRAHALHSQNPHEILHKVNTDLNRDNDQCMFVTVFLAVYNHKDGSLAYANGGHNPPCIVKADGECTWLPLEAGVALGVMEGMAFTLQSLQLQPGDGLFIYTDGVTEATSPNFELFGEARLQALLQQHYAGDAESVTTKVIDEVFDFSAEAGQADDITVMHIVRGKN